MKIDIKKLIKKPNLSITGFVIYAVLLNIALYHLPFFAYTISKIDLTTYSGYAILSCAVVALFAVNFLIFFTIAAISSHAIKWISIIFFITNSVAVYFVQQYNIILSKSIISSTLNTQMSEAVSYYSYEIFIYLFFIGILPAIFTYRIQINKSAKESRIRVFLKGIYALIFALIFLLINFSVSLWIDKNSKYLGGLAMPWSYVINTAVSLKDRYDDQKEPEKLPDAYIENNDDLLVLMIIGEASRRNNYSLYGYTRETNPTLKTMNILALKAKSAATYTTASLSAMFSHEGRKDNKIESFPDYLQRYNVDVIWRTSNWGDPTRHIKKYIKKPELTYMCKQKNHNKDKLTQENLCNYDEVLFFNLKNEIKNIKTKKSFVVIHTYTSHGPLYYEKYPKEFKQFSPVCKSVDLGKCTNKSLINAYDNTIVYTDYLISSAIKTLKKIKKPSVLIFLSDHGESLGEYGLYLHGAPNAIAPDVQRDVPLIIWASDSYLKSRNIKSLKDLDIDEDKIYSDDNIFHTLAGLFSMKTPVYKKDLDILR